MRKELALYSLLSAAWALSASLLGAWLGISEDAVFAIAIAIVPVLVLAWGRSDIAPPQPLRRTGRSPTA